MKRVNLGLGIHLGLGALLGLDLGLGLIMKIDSEKNIAYYSQVITSGPLIIVCIHMKTCSVKTDSHSIVQEII